MNKALSMLNPDHSVFIADVLCCVSGQGDALSKSGPDFYGLLMGYFCGYALKILKIAMIVRYFAARKEKGRLTAA